MRLTGIAIPIVFLAGGIAEGAVQEPNVRFQLGDVTARPGQTDVSIPFSIYMGSGVKPITGWSVAITYDPDVMGSVRIENAREADFFSVNEPGEFYDAGKIAASLVYAAGNPLDSDRYIRRSNHGIVANLRFCVLPDAPAGISGIGFAFQPDGPGLPAVANTITSDSEMRAPIRNSGFIIVEGDPVPGGLCQRDEPSGAVRPPLPDPSTWMGNFTLVGGRAQQGGELVVPFFISANVPGRCFGFCIDFDEEVLEAVSIEKVFLGPDGSDWDFYEDFFDNSNLMPGSAGTDEGFLVGFAVLDLRHGKGGDLPVNVENEILRIHFRVKPDAPLGETQLSFLDGGAIPGDPPLPNFLSLQGVSSSPEMNVTPSFVLSRITVLPDGALFVRGDSNGDEIVDLTDVVWTLGYLFQGGSVWCEDASDANDDGKLDISDPVITLLNLFLGGNALPPPHAPGQDLTPDSLAGCPSR